MTYDPGNKKFCRLVPQLPRELVIILEYSRGREKLVSCYVCASKHIANNKMTVTKSITEAQIQFVYPSCPIGREPYGTAVQA